MRTYVCHVVAECLASYPQILTGKDVIQPLIEVAIRREPYVVEHRATTKHSRHGLWKEEKTTFFHAMLSWKTWNFLFWGNHVLSCPTEQNKTKKYFKETVKRLTGLISCSGCLYDLMTPGSWNYTPFTIATTLYMIVLQHPSFHYGEGVYGKQEATRTHANNIALEVGVIFPEILSWTNQTWTVCLHVVCTEPTLWVCGSHRQNRAHMRCHHKWTHSSLNGPTFVSLACVSTLRSCTVNDYSTS